MPQELENCVTKVMDMGHDQGSAYAICRASMNMCKQGQDIIKMATKIADETKKKMEMDKMGKCNG